jgi:hypothetical protein
MSEEDDWRTLTTQEIYAMLKETHYNKDNNVKHITLVWACSENGRKWKSEKELYMNLEATKLRGRPRNRWQDEVREDGRLVDGKGWKEMVYNREELKKLLRMARNRRILHMSME